MLTIGDFARHGRVSVRVLRHYDAIGLLRPAHVDQSSGYRFYKAAQLSRLNRIVALKGLGFTLQQVQAILDEDVSTEELRGMLRLRQAELEAVLAETAAGLVQVEARLRSIENEGSMPLEDVIIRQLPAVRLAELSGTAPSFSPGDTGPLIGRLFDELRQRLNSAGIIPAGPRTVYFETPGEGEYGIVVHAGLPVSAGVTGSRDFQVVALPAVEHAATIVHRGLSRDFLSTSQLLVRWVDAHGYRFDGHAREVTLDSPENPDEWMAELQAPVVMALSGLPTGKTRAPARWVGRAGWLAGRARRLHDGGLAGSAGLAVAVVHVVEDGGVDAGGVPGEPGQRVGEVVPGAAEQPLGAWDLAGQVRGAAWVGQTCVHDRPPSCRMDGPGSRRCSSAVAARPAFGGWADGVILSNLDTI